MGGNKKQKKESSSDSDTSVEDVSIHVNFGRHAIS